MNLRDIEDANVGKLLAYTLDKNIVAHIACNISKDPFTVLSALKVELDTKMLISLFKRKLITRNDPRILHMIQLYTETMIERTKCSIIQLAVLTNNIPDWVSDLIYRINNHTMYWQFIDPLRQFAKYAFIYKHMPLLMLLCSTERCYSCIILIEFGYLNLTKVELIKFVDEYSERNNYKYDIEDFILWDMYAPLNIYLKYHGNTCPYGIDPWRGDIDQFIRLINAGIINLPDDYIFEFNRSNEHDIYDYYKLKKYGINVVFANIQGEIQFRCPRNVFAEWYVTGEWTVPAWSSKHVAFTRLKDRYQLRAAIIIQRFVRRFIMIAE